MAEIGGGQFVFKPNDYPNLGLGCEPEISRTIPEMGISRICTARIITILASYAFFGCVLAITTFQLPRKIGLRFSAKAAHPSI